MITTAITVEIWGWWVGQDNSCLISWLQVRLESLCGKDFIASTQYGIIWNFPWKNKQLFPKRWTLIKIPTNTTDLVEEIRAREHRSYPNYWSREVRAKVKVRHKTLWHCYTVWKDDGNSLVDETTLSTTTTSKVVHPCAPNSTLSSASDPSPYTGHSHLSSSPAAHKDDPHLTLVLDRIRGALLYQISSCWIEESSGTGRFSIVLL